MNRFRGHLTYANVMATLALFIALGGSSYAALRIGTKEVRNNSLLGEDIRNRTLRGEDILNRSLSGRDLARNTVGGRQINESSLAAVPDAVRLGGSRLADLKVRCPVGTLGGSGLCIEQSARPADAFRFAGAACASAGRRLPTYSELDGFRARGIATAPAGEWTSDVYQDPSGADPSEQLEVVVLVPNVEGVAFRQVNTPAPLPFRCVALPAN
jgi:hypothetical protein